MSPIELCKGARLKGRLISFSLGHVLGPFRCEYEGDSELWSAKCTKCQETVSVHLEADSAVIRGFPTWQKCGGHANLGVSS